MASSSHYIKYSVGDQVVVVSRSEDGVLLAAVGRVARILIDIAEAGETTRYRVQLLPGASGLNGVDVTEEDIVGQTYSSYVGSDVIRRLEKLWDAADEAKEKADAEALAAREAAERAAHDPNVPDCSEELGGAGDPSGTFGGSDF